MSVVCSLFGHKPQEGVYNGAEYMRSTFYWCDGTGIVHARLIARCARCGREYEAGKLHLPRDPSKRGKP